MPTTSLPIPINGFTDSANHQHGADGFTTAALNIFPDDNWEHRKRVGVRQGFQAIADMGASDDENVQLLLTYEVYRGAALRQEVLIVSGGNCYYADQTGETHVINYKTDGADGKLVFASLPSVDETITIISTDETSVTYTAKGSANFTSNEFDQSGTPAQTATSLKGAIEHASGHNAKITVADDASGTLTLTQATAGLDGHTDMTSTLTGCTVTNFANTGVHTDDIIKGFDDVRGVQMGNDAFLVNGRYYYKIDMSETTPEIVAWYETDGSTGLPTDAGGNKCTIISRFGGRIVMAGLKTSRTNWFMSRIGDAYDWTFVSDDASSAQAGGTSTAFGKLGEPISALFPFGDSGLMMAGPSTLTYLTADPVMSGAQFIRMSNSVGVISPDSWCQGPEKTCYIVSTDGVYMIQPNSFNIQRGQGVSAGRLDNFFATVPDKDVDIRLAFDPSRMMILMFINREADPVGLTHYQYHIPTTSWWQIKTNDPRLDVMKTYCNYRAYSGEQVGLWIGMKSGRIASQPTTGVVAVDGSGSADPLKASGDNSPIESDGYAFSSRLAWSPINSGLSNQRMLMTELVVLMDTHSFPQPANEGDVTILGPTLYLYGADQAQVVADVGSDIELTETRTAITGGTADGAQTETAISGGTSTDVNYLNYSRRGTLTLTYGTGTGSLTAKTLTIEDSTATTHEITFDDTVAVAASTHLIAGILDASDATKVLQAVKQSLDSAKTLGLIGATCEEPSGSTMKIIMDDEGDTDAPVATGTSVSNNWISGSADAGDHDEFLTGGLAASLVGSFTLVDDAVPAVQRQWNKGGYRVKRCGTTAPAQWLGHWAIFEGTSTLVPEYVADSVTATIPESTWDSVEILPSGYVRSTVTIDTDTEDENKIELGNWDLVSGRNKRFRMRKRESDFSIEMRSTGTSWVLEDMAVNIEQGGMFRTVKV